LALFALAEERAARSNALSLNANSSLRHLPRCAPFQEHKISWPRLESAQIMCHKIITVYRGILLLKGIEWQNFWSKSRLIRSLPVPVIFRSQNSCQSPTANHGNREAKIDKIVIEKAWDWG
jgi:hypothetical protein